jgi:hypothetical protein
VQAVLHLHNDVVAQDEDALATSFLLAADVCSCSCCGSCCCSCSCSCLFTLPDFCSRRWWPCRCSGCWPHVAGFVERKSLELLLLLCRCDFRWLCVAHLLLRVSFCVGAVCALAVLLLYLFSSRPLPSPSASTSILPTSTLRHRQPVIQFAFNTSFRAGGEQVKGKKRKRKRRRKRRRRMTTTTMPSKCFFLSHLSQPGPACLGGGYRG